MLGSFKIWNILQLSHKTKSCEEIDKSNQVVLDGICVNMDSLVKTWKYGAINTTYTTIMGYYAIKLISEDYIYALFESQEHVLQG